MFRDYCRVFAVSRTGDTCLCPQNGAALSDTSTLLLQHEQLDLGNINCMLDILAKRKQQLEGVSARCWRGVSVSGWRGQCEWMEGVSVSGWRGQCEWMEGGQCEWMEGVSVSGWRGVSVSGRRGQCEWMEGVSVSGWRGSV